MRGVKIARRLTPGSDLFPASTAQAANRPGPHLQARQPLYPAVYSGGQHYPDAAAQLGSLALVLSNHVCPTTLRAHEGIVTLPLGGRLGLDVSQKKQLFASRSCAARGFTRRPCRTGGSGALSGGISAKRSRKSVSSLMKSSPPRAIPRAIRHPDARLRLATASMRGRSQPDHC